MLQIITDSASDITLAQAAAMNIHVVPIKIQFEDGVCLQETEEDFAVFYDRLQKSRSLPVTSQPSPEQYLTLFSTAKENGDDVLVLPISSGLSGSINGIQGAKELCDYDRIFLWAMASFENITYISVLICFVMFLVNDLYGFVSWKRMEKRQLETAQ